MEIEVTSKVASHHTNPNYKCLLVKWNGEPNFRCVPIDHHNWMPTDDEMLRLVKAWIDISPTAWPLILQKVKPATYLHEVL